MLFHSLRQDRSTVAQRAEMTVAECVLTSCVRACFLDRIPTLHLDSIVSPIQLHCVKGECMLWCNLPSALLAEWSGSFTCQCGNMGVEWTPNKSQHRKLTLQMKFFPPLLPGLKLETSRSLVRRSYQQVIPALCTAIWAAWEHVRY